MKLEVGMKGHFSKKITEAMINEFAEISGDTNPVHLNEDVAEKSIFGKRVAHGLLSASLISAVLGTIMPGEGTIYLGQSLRFLRPVYIGDNLKAEATILSISEKRIAELNTVVTNQNGDVVIEGIATVKLPESND